MKTDRKDLPDSLSVQVGGNHYKDMVIQPIEFTMRNNLNFCQGNIIKYVTRYKAKNGIEDLKKAKHYIDLLIDMEYGSDRPQQPSTEENVRTWTEIKQKDSVGFVKKYLGDNT